jgi:hypothetical protein
MNKKKIVTIFLLSFCFVSVWSQELEGTWQGRLVLSFFKQDVRIVMHFTKDSVSGAWSGYVESTNEDARKMDIDIELVGDSLFLDIPSMNTHYAGKYYPDSTAYIGLFKQGVVRLPFKLVKGEEDDILYHRPQKPKRPFPYVEEQVLIENKKDSLMLAGTLTKPKGKGKYPAVILISGSGPEDRDESVFGHKPFLLIADYLTRQGIAVLRCDDRGTAKSTGNYRTATARDFAADVEVQLEYLRSRKDIDKRKIGLLGHSEGGIIAPIVAVKRKEQVAFIALLAAPGMDLFKLLEVQDSLISVSEGETAKEIQKNLEQKRKVFEYVHTLPDSATIADSIDQYLRQEKVSDFVIAATLRQLLNPWMMGYVDFEPVDNLKKLQCPVLAVNGEKDIQVPAVENIELIRRALDAGGNKKYETHIFPGLNHLFQKCSSCTIREYVNLDETFNEEALRVITDWVKKTIN